MKRPRVLLADDHRIVLDGLRGILQSEFYLEEFTWLFVLLTAVVVAGIYLASKFSMIPRG